ncbi:uncharacterized protein [Notamacropus eugenii]|uniref:uncharacterized protein n=1 Tax=Notamacropus eugenii TaxID=9315 RepID=UPI003B67212A
MNAMEYYCSTRNDELTNFRKPWEDLYEALLSEVSRARCLMAHSDEFICFQQCKDLRQLQKTPNVKKAVHVQKNRDGKRENTAPPTRPNPRRPHHSGSEDAPPPSLLRSAPSPPPPPGLLPGLLLPLPQSSPIPPPPHRYLSRCQPPPQMASGWSPAGPNLQTKTNHLAQPAPGIEGWALIGRAGGRAGEGRPSGEEPALAPAPGGLGPGPRLRLGPRTLLRPAARGGEPGRGKRAGRRPAERAQPWMKGKEGRARKFGKLCFVFLLDPHDLSRSFPFPPPAPGSLASKRCHPQRPAGTRGTLLGWEPRALPHPPIPSPNSPHPHPLPLFLHLPKQGRLRACVSVQATGSEGLPDPRSTAPYVSGPREGAAGPQTSPAVWKTQNLLWPWPPGSGRAV